MSDEFKHAISSIDEIIEDARNGRMFILVDAEDRENEGDLVIPAQMATPDAINFMAKHGRGLVCLSLTTQRASDLRLEAMVRDNGSRNRTAFTVSIEAREGISTGISAHDRARTIATAIDPTKGAADIVSPGHVFPLVARDGGVLIRAGHTEAGIDLARLAGLYPAAVICEIMNDDGTMARMPDLVPFAKRHGLKIGSIENLIAYRLQNDTIVRQTARKPMKSAFGGAFDLCVYETTVEPGEHVALVKGDVTDGAPVLVRVHAVDPMADLVGIGAAPGENGLIERSMRAIEAEGRGVIVVIRDLNPRSFTERIAARHLSGDAKGGERRQVEIGIGSQILRDLGIGEMVLLTNSPQHVYVGLEAFGLRIVGTRSIG
ncbi:MAG: 3,4-dihydroxy-2-butanone-4-phosphate synthase [Hyphomicrobiaceae bacterium]|nr:3,4-dihydroxy-2-butanone-4-phosphate synthase [Hyphomicrobiaceae bacterium]